MARQDSEESFGRFVLDVLVNSVIIIILFFVGQKTIAAPFQVIGNSMFETLNDKEYIIVSKLDYFFGEPNRGDIVVFHPPVNTEEYYIKRIIGVPGDTVKIKAGEVFVNDTKLDENYLKEGMVTCLAAHMRSCGFDEREFEVPEGRYFVLGDNRTGSSDSRAWIDEDGNPDPFITMDQIQGKTRLVVYPLPSLRLVPSTAVFEGLSSANAVTP